MKDLYEREVIQFVISAKPEPTQYPHKCLWEPHHLGLLARSAARQGRRSLGICALMLSPQVHTAKSTMTGLGAAN